MNVLLLLAVTGTIIVQQPVPPRPPAHLMEKGTSSSDLPVSDVAMVSWMMQGPAEAPSDLLFVVWRGQPQWYSGSRRSSSGGSSGTNFTSSSTYGAVRVDLEFDRSRRVATVQGKRIEMGDANVILVDDVDQPGATRIVKTLRVEHQGDRQPGPAGPVRALGSSPEIVAFIGCSAPEAGTAAGWCRFVVGKGMQE